MPEIPTLFIVEWNDRSGAWTYSVETIDGELVAEDAIINVQDLVELQRDFNLSRWSEPTEGDGAPRCTALVGWAQAPITRDDVERSYHTGHHGEPMVNIKVRSFDLPKDAAFDELVDEFAADLDPRLARLDRSELRALIERYVEKDEGIFGFVCEGKFEYAEHHAQTTYFPDYGVRVFSAGRSGGWAVVEGLPEVNTWSPELLTKWSEFETFCRELADDVPRDMAWNVLANYQDELAGRVVRVELTMVLCDADLEEVGVDPTEWDWRAMLDLGVDSTISVRDLKGN